MLCEPQILLIDSNFHLARVIFMSSYLICWVLHNIPQVFPLQESSTGGMAPSTMQRRDYYVN
jgi:hypothetical protein